MPVGVAVTDRGLGGVILGHVADARWLTSLARTPPKALEDLQHVTGNWGLDLRPPTGGRVREPDRAGMEHDPGGGDPGRGR